MSVYLSHISEEAAVASVLTQWVESSLDRDVRLSGEVASAELGDQRLAHVAGALSEAKVVLLLCSRLSIGRPWVSFEAGCAWFKRLPVVCVCHSGCSTADLPTPLGGLQAFDLTDAASCRTLLETLASLLQRKRVPRIDYDLMVAELKAAVQPIDIPASNDAPVPVAARQAAPEPVPARRRTDAQPQSMELRLMVAMKRAPDFTCTAAKLAASLEERESRVRDTLDKLVHSNMLAHRASIHPGDPDTRYALTDNGRRRVAGLGR